MTQDSLFSYMTVIPRTGEQLPVIGLGTAIVFNIGDDAAKRAERRTVIRTMVEGGARLIDTAPSYGPAEVVRGDLLDMLDNLDAGRGRLPDAAMRRKMVDFFESPSR